ncbi:MAG: methyltransferase domain-containing protein [Caulobacteraceae bacterium]|nr:methyltransferase domain-containing protein [Caulobacteraceae bacterium]
MFAEAANEAQVEYWNTGAGPVWVEFQDKLDRQLDPLGRAAMSALDVRPGDRVLDIGCGCGHTTLALAQAVGMEGEVLGVDVSEPMLTVARRRAAGRNSIHFVQADAQSSDLGAGRDAAFSRFGVMFFADPTTAFRNIGQALRPGGRLAFVCWRSLAENLWMRGPVEAAAPFLPPSPPQDPHAPGPFAFADDKRVRGILEGAGWSEVEIRPHDDEIGIGGVDETMALSMKVGPLGAALRATPDAAPSVMQAVRNFLSRYEGPNGVRMPAASWIVTATRS